MKFNISRPPSDGDIKRLVSWLFSLTEKLNTVLSSIGEDNLSEDVKNKLNAHNISSDNEQEE